MWRFACMPVSPFLYLHAPKKTLPRLSSSFRRAALPLIRNAELTFEYQYVRRCKSRWCSSASVSGFPIRRASAAATVVRTASSCVRGDDGIVYPKWLRRFRLDFRNSRGSLIGTLTVSETALAIRRLTSANRWSNHSSISRYSPIRG